MQAIAASQLPETAHPAAKAEDSPELHLLQAIGAAPKAVSSARIASLALNDLNWDAFLDFARAHRILPLAFSRLAAAGASLPPSIEARLRDAWHRNIFHATANVVELAAVLAAFESESIDAMPFKGIVLAAAVYHDLAARNAGDIDILVRRSDLLRATAILLARGFDLLTPVGQDGSPVLKDSHEYHFERRSDGMVVELRWRLELTQPRYRHDLGMQWIWPHRQTVRVAGVDFPNMDPETSLLVLCMHGSKHVWSRLVWISDVAHLLAASPAVDWQRVFRDARRLGLRRALALGVLLAHRVCAAQIPHSVLRRLESDATAIRLVSSLEEILFRNPGMLPAGRVPYNVQILGFTDRLWVFLSLPFLRPNEHDLAFIRLPRALRPLYFFVRPFRIFSDRSAR